MTCIRAVARSVGRAVLTPFSSSVVSMGGMSKFPPTRRGGHREEMFRLARIIKADGWRQFLGREHPDNLTAIYKYIEKADGRKPKTYSFPCAYPLARNNKLYTLNKEECTLLG